MKVKRTAKKKVKKKGNKKIKEIEDSKFIIIYLLLQLSCIVINLLNCLLLSGNGSNYKGALELHIQ